MDSITQAALGAVIGELTLGRKIGRRAIIWGATFGTLPDLDALLLPFFDTAQDLAIHRGATHSILVSLAVPALLAKPMAQRWKKDKVTSVRAFWFIFLTWATHILIDCFTVYGTRIYWPFSSYPVGLDNLFIIDPVFTLPLLVAIVWGLTIKGREWKKGIGLRMAAVCLAISSVYVGLSFWAKEVANDRFASDLENRGISYRRSMEGPSPLNIFLWRSVIERENDFWIGYYSVFDKSESIRWSILQKQPEVLKAFADVSEVKAVQTFSKGWLLARPTARGVWLVDLRFGEYRKWSSHGVELRPIFAWEYQRDGRGDKLKTTRPSTSNRSDMFSAIWNRALGNQTGWLERPRLIGNPAMPQEFIATLE